MSSALYNERIVLDICLFPITTLLPPIWSVDTIYLAYKILFFFLFKDKLCQYITKTFSFDLLGVYKKAS